MKSEIETSDYLQLEFKEWDRKTPVYSQAFDKFFFTVEELSDFTYELEITDDENGTMLKLVLCKPQYLWQIDFSETYIDILPDDMDIDDVASKELMTAIDYLNNIIKHHKPVSWVDTNIRTI